MQMDSVLLYVWYTHLLVHLPDVVVLDGKDDEASGILAQKGLQRRVEGCYGLLHEGIGRLADAIHGGGLLGQLSVCLVSNGHLANVVGAIRQNLLARALLTTKNKEGQLKHEYFSAA